MFDKLRSGLTSLINKVTTTEIKTESLTEVLSTFEIMLIENDVALSVAEKICEEIAKRLEGIQVKRYEDRKRIVKNKLRAGHANQDALCALKRELKRYNMHTGQWND